MGFADTLRAAVSDLMVTLGDLAPEHIYVSANLASGTYDTATGVYTPSADTRLTGIKMVLARFSIEEMDDKIVPTTDLKALIAAADLSVTPKEQDTVELTDGRKFMVERIMGVPGESLHILQIRRTVNV